MKTTRTILFVVSIGMLMPCIAGFRGKSITDKDSLMLIAEGIITGAVAATSAMKFTSEANILKEAPKFDLFHRLAVLLGTAYAVRKLAPHSHECLQLQKPQSDDKEDNSDKKVVAFLKGMLAGYVGLVGGLRGLSDGYDLIVKHDGRTPRDTFIEFGGDMGLLYSAYKLLPYSYYKLKAALS